MASRTRILIGIVAALLAWMLGYGMGGGFHLGERGAADSHDDAAADGGGPSLQNRTTPAADETLAEQIAARHIPWTRERLLASISAFSRTSDILQAARIAMKFAEQLRPEDFPLALDVAREMEEQLGEEGNMFKALVLMRWAEMKPEAVADYLNTRDEVGGGKFSENAMLLAVWGASDPAAAIAWAKSRPEAESRKQALKEILKVASRRDLDAAITLARTHAPELLTDGSIGYAIESVLGNRDPERKARTLATLGSTSGLDMAALSWAQKDYAAAKKWAEDLPEGKPRAEAMQWVWLGLIRNNPAQAAADLTKAAEGEPYIESSAAIIATSLAEKDPQEAARWAATLQQSNARSEAFSRIGKFFAGRDIAGGGQWLRSLPEGSDRDMAIQGFASSVSSGQAKQAVEWAMAIQDTRARHSTLRSVFERWSRTDLSAALEWLQTSPTLSGEDRQAMLKTKD